MYSEYFPLPTILADSGHIFLITQIPKKHTIVVLSVADDLFDTFNSIQRHNNTACPHIRYTQRSGIVIPTLSVCELFKIRIQLNSNFAFYGYGI